MSGVSSRHMCSWGGVFVLVGIGVQWGFKEGI